MKINKVNIPGVTVTLTESEASELRHMLKLFNIGLKQGQHGSGTSVDNQIHLCDDLIHAFGIALGNSEV